VSRSFRDWAFGRRGSEHARRVYDRWSEHELAYALFVNSFLFGREEAFRGRTVASLELNAGETVLDVGCGSGRNLPYLESEVGPTGTVVGVDASHGMVVRASERGSTLDCETAVLEGDATRLPVCEGRFDAALATLSLSAIADTEGVVRGLYDALRPGGRLAVLDARSFRTAPLAWLNPLVEGVSALLTNWHPDAPVVETVGEVFERSSVETFHGGTVYVVTGRKETSTPLTNGVDD
jgi:demethylmenaquinone methyltransferase/2-methoxy-6-polyprenyl-1,4-benzoquinol methylase